MKKVSIQSAQSKLRNAIQILDKATTLKILHQYEVSVNEITKNGDTLLHSALRDLCSPEENQEKVIDILTLLLDLGLNVDAQNRRGETALHYAVLQRLGDVVDFLIKRGATVNVTDPRNGNSIAHCLVKDEFSKFQKIPFKTITSRKLEWLERQSANFVGSLLSKGFDFDCKNNEDRSPLHLAIEYNLQHILPTMLNQSRDIAFTDDRRRTLLHIFLEVSARDDEDYERMMIPHRLYKGWYLPRIVTTLLDKGVAIDAADVDGMTPLHSTFNTRDMKMLKLLLEHAFENEFNERFLTTFLHYMIKDAISLRLDYENFAKTNDPSETLRTFMSAIIPKTGKYLNEPISGNTTVQLAVLEKRLDVIKLLIGNGARFDVVNSDGKNLLHLLSQNHQDEKRRFSDEEYEEVVDILVSQGCEVDATSKMRQSPLHEASANGKLSIMRKLIEYGADVNLRKDVLMMTPLHLAAENDQPVEVAELLVTNGANVNLRDACGRTPLHLTLENSARLARMLLGSGAQADIQDELKRTPLYLAILKRHLREVRELLKYGANVNDYHVVYRVIPRLDEGPIRRRLIEHCIKLAVADLPYAIEYKPMICGKIFDQWRKECRQEIRELKTYFADERMSLLDFLHMDPNRRCAYVSSKKLQNFIESSECRGLFMKYSDLILASYHDAVARKPLLRPAKRAWYDLTNIILPDVCLDRVLAYLSNATLVVLIGKKNICDGGD